MLSVLCAAVNRIMGRRSVLKWLLFRPLDGNGLMAITHLLVNYKMYTSVAFEVCLVVKAFL